MFTIDFRGWMPRHKVKRSLRRIEAIALAEDYFYVTDCNIPLLRKLFPQADIQPADRAAIEQRQQCPKNGGRVSPATGQCSAEDFQRLRIKRRSIQRAKVRQRENNGLTSLFAEMFGLPNTVKMPEDATPVVWPKFPPDLRSPVESYQTVQGWDYEARGFSLWERCCKACQCFPSLWAYCLPGSLPGAPLAKFKQFEALERWIASDHSIRFDNHREPKPVNAVAYHIATNANQRRERGLSAGEAINPHKFDKPTAPAKKWHDGTSLPM